MSTSPFALHITWTTYGTWLPGDKRGYVSNTHLPGGGIIPKKNIYGTEYDRNDPHTRRIAYSEQQFPTVWLTKKQALVVAKRLIEACVERQWWIAQAAIMSNHVHVVLMQCPQDGPAVRRILKGTTQAALSELAGKSIRTWTTRGSDRYKFDQRAIDNAIEYVRRQEHMLVGIENMKIFIPGDGSEVTGAYGLNP